jgi:hypothetical protein
MVQLEPLTWKLCFLFRSCQEAVERCSCVEVDLQAVQSFAASLDTEEV